MANLAEHAFAHWEYDEELERQREIVRAREYHEGEQRTLLTPRLREFLNLSYEQDDDDFNLNVTRGVIEAVSERLLVAGFKCPDEASQAFAWQVWQNDRVYSKANEVHENTLVDGESFVIIDVDPVSQSVSFIPHKRYTDAQVDGENEGCKAHYRNGDYNQPLESVSKRWVEWLGNGQARQRLTVYYPDRIEKYEMRGEQFTPIAPDTMAAEGDTVWPLPWMGSDGKPLGIPVAHFRNPQCRPEAADAESMQNAINKTLIDLLAAGDVTAFRIFVAFGFIPTTDGKPLADDGSNAMQIAPGQIVGSSKSPSDASFNAIDGAPLDSLIGALQQFVYYNAIVTRTPLSRYQFSAQVASADTIKQQNESLLAKIALRHTLFGDAWEDALTIARRLANQFLGAGLDESAQFQIQWQDPQTRDRLQELQALQIEKDSLEVPLAMLWAKAGYRPDEIEEMMSMREAELEMKARVASMNLAAPVEGASV